MIAETTEQMVAKIDLAQVRTLALAGNATLTIRNVSTGNRITYRIVQCDDKADLYFVSVLTGADNGQDYTYLGIIREGAYSHGRKSRIGAEAISAKAFAWFWAHVDALPGCVEVWRDSHCLRCGRTLTVPESCERGLGPECAKKV